MVTRVVLHIMPVRCGSIMPVLFLFGMKKKELCSCSVVQSQSKRMNTLLRHIVQNHKYEPHGARGKSKRTTSVIRIHPLGAMIVCVYKI